MARRLAACTAAAGRRRPCTACHRSVQVPGPAWAWGAPVPGRVNVSAATAASASPPGSPAGARAERRGSAHLLGGHHEGQEGEDGVQRHHEDEPHDVPLQRGGASGGPAMPSPAGATGATTRTDLEDGAIVVAQVTHDLHSGSTLQIRGPALCMALQPVCRPQACPRPDCAPAALQVRSHAADTLSSWRRACRGWRCSTSRRLVYSRHQHWRCTDRGPTPARQRCWRSAFAWAGMTDSGADLARGDADGDQGTHASARLGASVPQQRHCAPRTGGRRWRSAAGRPCTAAFTAMLTAAALHRVPRCHPLQSKLPGLVCARRHCSCSCSAEVSSCLAPVAAGSCTPAGRLA